MSAKTLRITLGIFGAVLAGASVFAAAVLDPSSKPYWQSATFTLKSTLLSEGATKAYQPWFENGAWTGKLVEWDIAMSGARTRTEDSNWEASAVFDTKESEDPNYWKARKIITYKPAGQQAFRWDKLEDAQKTALDPVTAADTGATDPYDSPILNFIRGDRSQEGTYRIRLTLLGDIINSQPVYVGAPTGNYFMPGYAAFKNDNKDRAGRLYIGANDGMLHVFNASDGSEVYSYVPSMVFSNLDTLTKIKYHQQHTYYVDGQLVQGDAKIGSDWKTILAGGLGLGGKGLFALDVTNPDLSSELENTGNYAKILWERTSSLGYIHGNPYVAMLPDGKWYVVSGNGYGSDDGTAKLVLAPLNSDATTLITTGAGADNGLSPVSLLDIDYDGDADYAYAGDLLGNLWKFDLANSTATKLFAAGDSQPITSAPEIANHTYGGYLIYFGTGSLLSSDDADNIDQQTIYAIWDNPNNPDISYPVVTANLVAQTLTADTHAGAAPDDAEDDTDVRIASDNAIDWTSQYGWKVNLPAEGERLLGNPQLRDGRLVFVTHSPDRASWLMGLDWWNGGDPGSIQFDLDGNGHLDAKGDMVSDKFPVGRLLGSANYAQPAIAQITSGTDILFVNGFKLPIFEPDSCTGACTGGIDGGHVDVDMDSLPNGDNESGLGGKTVAHKHEYDDAFDITYVDYFQLLVGRPFHDVVDDWDVEFIPILANADLSPGGVITIGDKQWNVVEYQEMVQKVLTNWNSGLTKHLVDDDGDSLIHTINEISGAGGTIRISFDDQAITSGGLMPTQTGCVTKDNDYINHNGRWRNGALTIHMLRLDEIEKGSDAGNAWVAQTPGDLVTDLLTYYPDEVYGGLHANPLNDAGFLFESTLFWHFESPLAEIILREKYPKEEYPDYEFKKPCYGDPFWEQVWEIERIGLSEALLEELFPGDGDQIINLAIELRTVECGAGSGEACSDTDEYKAIDAELAALIGKDYEKKFKPYLIRGDSRIGTNEGTGDGTSVETEVQDKTEDLSPSPGIISISGRQGWIDI